MELIGKRLRVELAEALKASVAFKNGYFNAFINICLNSRRDREPDMQALITSNYTFINDLRSSLDMLRLNDTAIPVFQSYDASDKLKLCIERLNATIQSDHFSTSILESYLQVNYPDITIKQLHECCEIFLSHGVRSQSRMMGY